MQLIAPNKNRAYSLKFQSFLESFVLRYYLLKLRTASCHKSNANIITNKVVAILGFYNYKAKRITIGWAKVRLHLNVTLINSYDFWYNES